MEKTYSIYEARSHFSELVRLVMQSFTIVITHRGKPVVRMLPYEGASEEISLEDRLRELESQGLATKADDHQAYLNSLNPNVVPGALQRFLEDR